MNSMSYNICNRIMYMMERTCDHTTVCFLVGGVLTAAYAVCMGFFIVFFSATLQVLS